MKREDIIVNNLTIKFRLSSEKIDSFKEYLLRLIKRNLGYEEFTALNSVSFKICQGERVGIIGHNGAGKSTLLKAISGVIKPTSGEMKVNGNIAPLLELGAGFDQDLSGAENIYLNAAILGKNKDFIKKNYNNIIEFSDLGDFIYTPVKNYSSGMRARLGFSIAVQTDPDILIIDEILGVGDEKFRKKSSEKMREIMDSGKTVILVSHNLSDIEELTDKVIWLNKGEIREIGESKLVCSKYRDFMN